MRPAHHIDTGFLHILRTITTPARRHRCDVCREVFECHLCVINENNETHVLHGHGERRMITWEPLFVCMDCIDRHNLAIVVVRENSDRRGKTSNSGGIKFYDHTTGQLIGMAQPRKPRPKKKAA